MYCTPKNVLCTSTLALRLNVLVHAKECHVHVHSATECRGARAITPKNGLCTPRLAHARSKNLARTPARSASQGWVAFFARPLCG